MLAGGRLHHLPLRLGPGPGCRQTANLGPFHQRRQLTRLGRTRHRAARSVRRRFARPGRVRSCSPSQPLPQRRHQVVVGELVASRLGRRRARASRPCPRGQPADEPNFPIQDVQQVGEIPRTPRIPRRVLVTPRRPHSCPLMLAPASGMRAARTACAASWCKPRPATGAVGGGEGLFEESNSDTRHAADFLERGWRPWFALHHLGEQGVGTEMTLPLLGRCRHRPDRGTPPAPCSGPFPAARRRHGRTAPRPYGRGGRSNRSTEPGVLALHQLPPRAPA